MMRQVWLYMILFFLPSVILAANGQKKIASIPFKIVGNYAVVEVSINGSTKLNLILDSGVSSTIITELGTEDSLPLNYAGKTRIRGLGSGEDIQAYISYGNVLRAGKMEIKDLTLHFLEKDLFNLSKHVGSKINGILGLDFFEGHIVKIDYNIQRITFYSNQHFEAPAKYSALPLVIERKKMFVNIPVTESDWSTRNAKMLIDTGAELTAWFRSTGTHPIDLPAKRLRSYIGQGLSGTIEGYMGRIYMINLGGHILYNPIVHFPDSTAITDLTLNSEREGTIGCQILNRFNLIFDMENHLLYVKPNWRFKKPFSYNIAGIEMILDNPVIPLPEIIHVREGSPADLAGVRVGDRVFQVNESIAMKTSINELKKYFEIGTRGSLRLILLREGKTVNVKLQMESVL